jgi:hypothetical protein
MNDIPDPNASSTGWSWQIGPAFLAILVQAVVGVFMLGGIWYRIDTSFSKIDVLATKLDVYENQTTAKQNRFEIFMAKVQTSYDAIKDRLSRVENKIDQQGPLPPKL